MKKLIIDIRGIILDASWDSDWLDSYIQKGVFTPESRVRAQLAQATKDGAEVEIYISSYGGSVIAGNEMLAAIQDFKGKKSITIGAFAASMAANIALQSGCEVRCHANSLFLFHGAFSVAFGGKGVMLDAAAILEKINAPLQKRLVELGVPEAKVTEGFAEGRELTMAADEALEYGIVSEIIGAPATQSAKVAKAEIDEMLAGGLPIEGLAAAWAAGTGDEGAGTGDEGAGTGDEGAGTGDEGAGTGDEGAGAPPESETVEARAGRLEAELMQARVAFESARAETKAVQSACDKRIMTMQSQLDAVIKEFNAFKDESGKAAGLAAEMMAVLKLDAKTAKDAHAALVGGVLANQDEADGSSTWPELVDRYGPVQALARFPAKAEEYRMKNQSRK